LLLNEFEDLKIVQRLQKFDSVCCLVDIYTYFLLRVCTVNTVVCWEEGQYLPSCWEIYSSLLG
jgi:hypothetical protein